MIARNSCGGRRVWDTARGVWTAGGLGSYNPFTDCDSFWSLLNPVANFTCLPHSAAVVYGNATGRPQVYPNPPAPAPPNVALVSQPAPGSVYAGQDSSGNPVYAVPETATDNMDRWRADAMAFYNAQGDLTPPTCETWRGYFDPSCSSFATTLVLGGVLVAGLVLLGGRR